MQGSTRPCDIPTHASKEDESMQEWDILSELASRIKQDTAGAWERVQAYYQEIGQSSILADIASLEGLTEFYAADYGITLQDFTYSTPNVVQVPVIARTDTFQNDGDETAQEEFEFSKSIAETFSFSFTEGLKVGAKASAKVGL